MSVYFRRDERLLSEDVENEDEDEQGIKPCHTMQSSIIDQDADYLQKL
jgi:hypothetical protein